MLEGGDEGISLASPDGDGPTLDTLPVPEGKQLKNRLHLHLHLHLDLRADGTSFEAEVVLLQGLGAPRVDVGRGSDVTSVV